MASTAVRVALRVRPLTQKEHLSNCTECISFIPNQPQILIGKDHSFTYDYVFDTKSAQKTIYETSVTPLLEKFVGGFNATILAYGQTGSGKTFSMGTALDGSNIDSEQQGIVPRFINDLYSELALRKEKATSEFKYQVYVTFLELYNEDLVDLLNAYQNQSTKKKGLALCDVQIREDSNKHIYWSGVREEPCDSPDELLQYLAKGSLCRTTGSTDMNSVSSRSHAIFSVILKQQLPEDDQTVPGNSSGRTVTSKFHFVDLAGSERLKRTNAQGDRAREGISINSGLLALGNVISALGDDSRKSSHVPYRDSKLTRLLQDSLGGNSQTLMMACVSPSDSNFLETLSTLKYANRARNIKNKVAINQEFAGSSVEVNRLRSQVAQLKMELNSLRSSSAGKSSSELVMSIFNTNDDKTKALQDEIRMLKEKVRAMSDEICQVTTQRDSLQIERELTEHLQSEDWVEYLNNVNVSTGNNSNTKTLPIISQYQNTIRDLRNELTDTQQRLAFCESMRAPLIQAMALTAQGDTPNASLKTANSINRSVTPTQRHVNGRKRGPAKKKRTANGSTTTSRNVTFRSTKRSKVPHQQKPRKPSIIHSSDDDDSEDIEEWLKQTIGGMGSDEASGLRDDAKSSIEQAKSEIDKALKILDEFKANEAEMENEPIDYNCDILADDELFVKLQAEENMSIFGDVEDILTDRSNDQKPIAESRIPRSRTVSAESGFESINGSEMNGFYEANPKLHRALTQIQSNIQVNENLVNQLEKTETEYSQMRNKFEKKIYDLHEEISSLRQMQNKNNILAQTKNPSQKEKKHMNEVRLAYENKMKVLMNQLSDLRRKYSQTSSTIQSSRNQNESTLKALRVSVESLKVEKRHMVKKMKDEAERVKEKLHSREREIQQLNRKQIKDNEARRRLEREGKRLEIIVQKKTDESIVTGEKLKRLVTILKKAVREGGVLNEKLLASCGSILDIGNVLVQTSNVNRLSRKRKTVKKNKLPVDIRADKKKHLLDQALSQFIQGKQAVEEMKQLLAKRNTLTQKKAEFISEREMLLADQDKDRETIDQAFTQVIDDNIESVEAEISYLNARIHAIHNDAANEIMQDDETDEIVDMSARQEKRVTFVDDVAAKSGNITQVDDEWLDMDSLEEKYSLSPSSGPEQCIDVIDRLLKSISPDESKFITEFIVDDLLLLRMEDSQNKKTFQQLEQTAQNLRCTLFVMKKAAIETTIENEKKIKKLQGSRRTSLSFKNSSPQSSHLEDGSDADSAIDLYSEEQYQHVETKFDKIYNDGISGNLVNASWEEYQFSRPTSPIMDTLPSPHLKPQLSQVLNGKSSVTGPLKPSASPLTNRRNSMTSPEQFLLHLLHTSKDARPPPPPSPLVKPAEFARYQAERESSTSSIRNRNPRRSSIQSDNFSLSSVSSINQQSHKMTRASSGSKVPINYTAETNQAMVNNTPLAPMLNRRRAFSFQQPTSPTPTPTNLRRRSLLREISNGIEVPKSPLQQQYFGNDINEDNKISRSYSNGTSLIPAFNNSMLLSSASHQTRPYSVLSLHSGPKPTKATAYPIKKEHSASNSYEMRRTPSTNNVFDRLSSGHTHASQAKKRRNNYRHSSSSIDDLRKKWSGEMENIV